MGYRCGRSPVRVAVWGRETHTGDDDAWYQTFFLENYVGLALGPNTSIFGPALIYQRSKDVRFVIDAMLKGLVDRKVRLVCDGGTLEAEWPEGGDVRQVGEVEVVCEGDWLE